MCVDASSASEKRPPSLRPGANRLRTRPLLRAGCLGVLLTIVLAVVARLLLGGSEGIPPLNRQAFDGALQLWEENGLRNYDLKVQVKGPQQALYTVEVRHGQAQSATCNGNPLTQQRTLSTWSVLGMFRTIEHDLLHTEGRVPLDNGTANRPRLVLRSKFHPTYGYPEQYERIEMHSRSQDISWKVIEFQQK